MEPERLLGSADLGADPPRSFPDPLLPQPSLEVRKLPMRLHDIRLAPYEEHPLPRLGNPVVAGVQDAHGYAVAQPGEPVLQGLAYGLPAVQGA